MRTSADMIPRERLASLDVFRGMTVAAMLLVNNPGSWGSIFPPLAHAEWHGWTPTDLIFPFFLFIVGVTTALSLSIRRTRGASDRDLIRNIVRRATLIVLCGLLLNAFPFYTWGSVEGVEDPTLVQRVLDRFEHLRFAGVLQRIGIAYLLGALLTLRTRKRTQWIVIATLLVGYWALLTLVPVPGTGRLGAEVLDQPSQTLAAWTDRLLLGEKHIWKSSRTWDPEGPLSTLPAIATVMLGVLAGSALSGRERLAERMASLFAMGGLGTVAGLIWSWIFPINKSLWTSSYVLFTAGVAAMCIATLLWLLERESDREVAPVMPLWARFFLPFGLNPIVAFVGSGIMARLLSSMLKVNTSSGRISLQNFLYAPLKTAFEPRLGSLLYALLFVLLWWAILYVMQRRNIFVKI